MSQPRKRPLHHATEYEDLARKEGWAAGFDEGVQEGREQAFYERGHQDGWHEGFAQASCEAYDRGYHDAKAGRLPQHQPHTIPDSVSELIDPDTHE